MSLVCRRTVAIVFVALLMPGCRPGAQGGKFSVSSTDGLRMGDCDGGVVLLRGGRPGSPVNDELLVVFAVILSNVPDVVGSGSDHEHAEIQSRVNLYWNYELGKTEFNANWNRSTDLVTLGDQQYERSKGIVFVVEYSNHKKFEVFQLPITDMSLADDEIAPAILRARPELRAQLTPKDE